MEGRRPRAHNYAAAARGRSGTAKARADPAAADGREDRNTRSGGQHHAERGAPQRRRGRIRQSPRAHHLGARSAAGDHRGYGSGAERRRTQCQQLGGDPGVAGPARRRARTQQTLPRAGARPRAAGRGAAFVQPRPPGARGRQRDRPRLRLCAARPGGARSPAAGTTISAAATGSARRAHRPDGAIRFASGEAIRNGHSPASG